MKRPLPFNSHSFGTALGIVVMIFMTFSVKAQLTTNNFGPQNICPGQALNVGYTSNSIPVIFTSYGAGNVFRVQLSNNTGGFGSGTTIISNADVPYTGTTNTSGTIPATIPAVLSNGTYRVRVISTNPAAGTLDNNGSDLTLTNPAINAPTIDATTPAPFCPGDPIKVNFSTSGCPFNAGNTFTLQLSDPSGTFPSPLPSHANLGTLSSTGGGGLMITGAIPSDAAPGTNYRVRVVSSNPAVNGPQIASPFTIKPPGFTNAPAPGTIICQGAAYDLTFNTFSGLTFNPGNVFIAEIGTVNAGVFSAVATLGHLNTYSLINSNTTQTIKAVIPFSISGTNLYMRWRSTNTAVESCLNGPYTIPAVRSFTDPSNQWLCSGTATFTANAPGSTYQWQVFGPLLFNMRTSGLGSIAVSGIAKSGTNVYAATGAGLSISTDGGLNFSSTVLGSYFINNVVVSGSNVYAATNNGLYKLDLAGNVVTHYTTAGPFFLPALNVTNVFVSGSDIYACTSSGLAKSTGGGAFSTLFSDPTFDVFVNGTYVYAATSAGVMVSQNGGANFDTYTTANGLGSNNVQSIFVRDNIVYAGTDFGLAYSTNTGTNGALQFTFTTTGLGANSIRDIFVTTDGRIYAATAGGLSIANKGLDNGAPVNGFTTVIAGLTNLFVSGIVEDAGSIYLSTLGGVAISPVSAPANLGTFASQNVTANPGNSLSRFQVVIREGGVCPITSNIVRIADIPPTISNAVDSTRGPSVCGGTTGRIGIQGLIPQTKYRLNLSGPSTGMPKNADTITTDQYGKFNINLLKAGTYTISVNSLLEPPANGCSSNVVMITINDPTRPTNPALAVSPVPPVCQGTNIVVTLTNTPLLNTTSNMEDYRWYTNAGATIVSPPSPTTSNVYSPTTIPTTPGVATLYVFKRDKITLCSSDTIPIPYIINPRPVISCSGTNPSTAVATDGSITISGLAASSMYTLAYTGGPGTPAPGTVTSNGAGQIVITGLGVGNYTNISVTTPAPSLCQSNIINSCPLFGPAPDDAIGAGALKTVVCGIQGTTGGYFQQVTGGGPASNDEVSDAAGGIAVGRIRQTSTTPANDQKVEMRGWLEFDLSSLPANAIIERVEYRAKSAQTFGQKAGSVDVLSATGDIQFDVTQVSPSNYGNFAGFNPAVFTDLFDTKYNDFTISLDATGANTDLGPQGVLDAQSRLADDGRFRLGLALSGSDFDIPVLQFHGMVFWDAEQHELCVTYHLEDFGDLPEPKYATDLAGGLVGPSHRIDSIDIDTRPTVTTRRPALYIGSTPPDAETNGQPSATADGDDANGDDENLSAASFSAGLVAGTTVTLTVPVTNFLPFGANLIAFIDWNNNGIFENATERYQLPVPAGTAGAPGSAYTGSVVFNNISVPLNVESDTIGVRVRITSGNVFDAYGPAPNGEVEDFRVELQALDFGDLPDPSNGIGVNNFRTRYADNGARHAVTIANKVYLGAAPGVDVEGDGQPTALADGDDKDDVNFDDENGIRFITSPLVPGQPATIEFTATNGNTTTPATLYLYADFNNDGINTLMPVTFTVPADAIIAPNTTVTRQLTFTMPLNAAYGDDKAYFRFRITTKGAPGPDGLTLDGEVEDYLSGDLVLYDWADLPEPLFNTDKTGGTQGPSHRIKAIDTGGGVYKNALFIGATAPDTEIDGQPSSLADGDDLNKTPDDEDLAQANFTNPATADRLIAGNTITITIPYTNILNTAAKMIVFLDWNGDGDFTDAQERVELAAPVTPPTGSTLVFNNVPIPVTTNAFNTGVRVRLTTAAVVDANGPVLDGEVEDFFVTVYGYDYGDLPDDDSPAVVGTLTAKGDYHTYFALDGTRGPRHLTNPNLMIGHTVDAEGDGQPQVNAFGDDISTIDDEDGVIQPDSVVRGKPAIFKVFVTNKTGANAYLMGFVDWNDDGSFEDASPNQKSGPITIPAGASGYYNVTFIVPTQPNPLPDRVAARFRLSPENTRVQLSTGPAQGATDIEGEVEDMWVAIVGYDWGDLPEPRYITDAAGGQQGASHKIASVDHDRNPNTPPVFALYIGTPGSTPPDPEPDAQPHPQAFGDDNNGFDDEDLSLLNFINPSTNLPYPLIAGEPIRLRVPVVNNHPDSTATLWAFIDWNGDGSFTGPQETSFLSVAPGFVGTRDFDFAAIPPIAKPDSIGVRVRFTTTKIIDAYGLALDGEVEDFIVELNSEDFGDLPDATAGVGPNDFQTLRARGGARHAVPVVPLVYMGANIDTEADGQPTAKGNGDDLNKLPDDEDGIIFLTPLVPGQQAKVSFSGVNNSLLTATLYMYADWNNDGTLDPVTPIGGPVTLGPSSSIAGQVITFNVPGSATFPEGNAFFRFRFSTQPVTGPNGLALDGEVEDYVVPVFKLGNLVWEDRNNNGLQDADEISLGIQNVRVIMRFGGIDPITGAFDGINQNTAANPNTTATAGGNDNIADFVIDTYTNSKGIYGFTGMIEGFYQVIAMDTFGLTPTRTDWIKNVTEEDMDSDGQPLKTPWDYILTDRRQSKSQVFKMLADSIGTDEEGILDQGNPQLLDPNSLEGFPDARVEQRIDFGYTGFDFGDLPQVVTIDPVTGAFITEENGTAPEGPKHILTPELTLGTCQDAEWEGQPDPDAGAEFAPAGPDGGGDDPIANFTGYPNATHDPSQGRRWPYHDAANSCGDDEDGVKFMTPLVAGYDAIISIKYRTKINLDGPDAYLHAWFDWNGDGNFDDGAGNIDPNEHIIFTKLNGGAIPIRLEANTQALILENSYLQGADSLRLTFKVPSDVAYNKGNILTRFRISYDPRLGPNGILAGNANFPDGIVPYGEVEDYFMKLTKVGNLVWEDRNYNGIQDLFPDGSPKEPSIANVPIRLEYAGVDGIFGTGDPYENVYHDTTDVNGIYYFCGLIGNVDPSGVPNPTYRLIVEDPDDMTSTFNNPDPSDDNCNATNSNGDDKLIDEQKLLIVDKYFIDRFTLDTFTVTNPMMLCVDENGYYDVGLLGNPPIALPGYPGSPLPPSPDALNNFPDNQYDETRDFGFVGFDYGDLPIASVKAGSNYPTLRDSMDAQFSGKFGARHAIQPRLYLGTGVDGELNGQPDDDAGSKAGGDDDDPSKFVKGTGADDENGILLLSPLLPGEKAYIKVNYTSQDTTNGGYVNRTAYLDAFVDWNGNGVFDLPQEKLLFTHQELSGASFSTNNVPALGTPVRTATLPATGANGVDSTILAFDVPVDAVFDTGVVYMRFRLGWTNYSVAYAGNFPNGLEPDNNKFHQATSPFINTAYPYPQGEVEDYGIPVAKIGNLAWFDHDVFGDQDSNEDVVDSLHLVLIWGGIDPATGVADTVGYQTSPTSLGAITDIQYNRTIAPPAVNTYLPGALVKTGISPAADSGLYSFRGLIPGTYYVIPLKYLQADSASFVDFWPKHRVLTLQDNPGVPDDKDSDGIDLAGANPGQVSRGPGAFVKITDGNPRYPEVCVNDRPLNESGIRDAADNGAPFTKGVFPPDQGDKSVDFGWIDEPNIEANLDIVGVDYPTSEICGNFNVIMHLCVKNPTEVPLDSLVMFLNLKNAYGDALYTNTKPMISIVDSAFVTDPAYVKIKKTMVGSKEALTPFINPNYDGVTDTKLLTGGDKNTDWYLPGDSIVCVRIEFEIDPTKLNTYNANNPKGWYSQGSAYARAVGFNWATGKKRPVLDFRFFDPQNAANPNPRFGLPIQVSDLSDEFDDPMPMAGVDYPDAGDGILFEGSVADRGLNGEYKTFPIPPSITGRDKYLDENDKTIQNDECWIKTKWNGGYKDINISMDSKCEAIIYADMLVPNHIDACGFDKYPEGSYYRVIIQDEHTGETVWASVDRVPFDASKYLGRKLIYKVRSVANHCHPIWGKLNLEDKTKPVVTCPADTKTKVGGTNIFVCTDIDNVLRVEKSWLDKTYDYYTGIATATDSCGEVYLDKVSDILEVLPDCIESAKNGYAYAIIHRTFHFRDTYGNLSTCTQKILFFRPTIVLPECKVEVPNNLAKGDSLLTPADLINKYKLADAIPYFINGAGKRVYLTGKDYCGFTVSYTDEFDFSTGACGHKIIRRWTLLDWCYGMGVDYPNYLKIPEVDGACYAGKTWVNKMYTWDQLIVVGDDNPPVVTIPDIDKDGFKGSGYKGGPAANPKTQTTSYDPGDVFEFANGPMDCSASFRVTRDMFEVVEQSGWCFDLTVLVRRPILDLDERPTGQFSLKTDENVKVTGNCKDGYNVTGVQMPKDTTTFWFLRLRFYDDCGKETIIFAPFRIIDKTAPVMKCDDKLIITLDNVGRGNVASKDVDEGSWDNCGKVVWVKVRRAVGNCAANFLDLKGFVDANKNGKIDADIDYIDENRNFKAEELEFFRINRIGSMLMTPLLDTIPFFCCDRDSIMVELWGEDKAGNRDFCWNWIKLEDKTGLDYALPMDQTYKCTDLAARDKLALLSKAGTYAAGTPEYNAAVALLLGDVQIIRGALCVDVAKAIVVEPKLHCDAGEILISWKLTKPTSKGDLVTTTPTRKITVLAVHEYDIMFPADKDGSCGSLADTTITIDELSCDVLAVNVQDKKYKASEGGKECFKIFRTFTVLNWCQYDDRCGEPMQWAVVVPRVDKDNDGLYEGVNVLVRDRIGADSKPGMDGVEEIYFEYLDQAVSSTCKVDKVGQECERQRSFNYNNDANAPCQYGEPQFAWMYTQMIKIFDNAKPTVDGTGGMFELGANCVGKVTIPFTGADDCSATLELETDPAKQGNIEIERVRIAVDPALGLGTLELNQLTGAFSAKVTRTGATSWTFEGNLPEGNHSLIINIRDECGNISDPKVIPFMVADKKAPVPICHNGLSTALMKDPASGNGIMVVWATDFVASPIYDCNGQAVDANGGGLKRITKYWLAWDKNGDGKLDATDGINDKGLPLVKENNMTVTCSHAGKNVMVRLYAEDERGNIDWCETFLTVTDQNKVCGGGNVGSGSIAGAIATETKANVEGVEVNLSGQSNLVNFTNANGLYSFSGLTEGYDFSVTPKLDKNYLNGVSTFDLVQITKHILGVQLLNTPYKMIAADINNSKTITTNDLIQLRKLILGIDAKLANNTSWRFVDVAFKFPNPANPWQTAFPEVVNINDLIGNVNANFVAIKVGDVNGNALASGTVRTSGAFELRTDEIRMKAGNEYRVTFNGDIAQIDGYQFTMGFDRSKVELVNIENGLVKEEHFGVFASEGLITTSWNQGGRENAASAPEGLFTLVLRAKADVNLSEVLNVNSRITPAEAYRQGGDYLNVNLNFGKGNAAASNFELMQNVPNPFQGETIVGFVLPEASEATLTIQDVTGRTLRVFKGAFDKGYNQITLKSNELNAQGVLYYTLKSGEFIATKKMIILE